MLLKSSLFILLLVNIFTSNLIILSIIFLIVLFLNLILNKNLKKHSRQLKVLLFFYLSTFIIQLYYGQQGKVLWKFYNFYITQEGLINFTINFVRILNLILMSWLINELKLLTGRLGKYQKIIDTVIELVPDVFILFKKRMKAKNFSRYILKEISKKYWRYRKGLLYFVQPYLLDKIPELEINFNIYQDIIQAIKHNNFKRFEGIVEKYLESKEKISEKMRVALKTLKKYMEYIKNMFETNITNGVIEGLNNKIKSIKRTAFGYSKFRNFKKRILIQEGIISINV